MINARQDAQKYASIRFPGYIAALVGRDRCRGGLPFIG